MQRRNSIDEETLQGLNQNDSKAQTQIFDHIYSYLVVYAEKMTSNHQVACEIASEALARLFLKKSKNFTYLGELINWLNTTAHNLCIDYIRQREKTRNQIPITDSLMEIESDFDHMVEFEQGVINLVYEAMQFLPPQQKLVLEQKLKGHSSKEIAQSLGKSKSTIDNHKCHAIKYIRQFLINRGKFPLLSDY